MAGGIRPQEIEYRLVDVTNPGDMETNVNNLRNSLGKLQLPEALKGKFDKLFDKVLGDVTKFKTAMETAGKSKSGLTAMEKATTSMKVEWQEIIKLMKQLNASDFKIELDTNAAKELEDLREKAQGLQEEFEKTSNLTSSMGKALKELSQVSKSKDIDNFRNLWKAGDIKGAEEALQRLKNNIKSFSNKDNLDAYSKGIQALSDAFYTGKEKAEGFATELQNNVNRQAEILAENSTRAQAGLDNMAAGAEKAASNTARYGHEALKAAENTNQMNQELEMVKSRISHFFGLANAVMLFRRALNNAMTTAKALDKAMTATAVVTNFSVGDMWKKLPEYTKQANALGATIEGVYQTMTLYYQQGLNTNQAMALGTHTIQMARIAGLDYATATDRMTAALRGFNMELNETNAERVADVYSALAANTAANVDEISTAMTKTASLASNAGMEFETTAAFLTQIIETTRESAETAGTALKTVIARFQELKKSPNEIGEIDGEIVDANKIETALRSVGVALRDNVTGEFRALDDVFLELASKWNTLDTNTQRYIATIAAGSRQQSRFIAMMQDYGRTTELVSVANDSAGASTAQFEKTLESFEAKLNQLKNAWDTFTMGLANSEFVKGVIDILTGILNGINKITTSSNNAVNSVLKLGAAFAMFKTGKALIGAILPSLTALKTGIAADEKFLKRLAKGFGITFNKSKTDMIKNASQNVVRQKDAYSQLTKAQKQYSTVANEGQKMSQAQAIATKNLNTAQHNYLGTLGLTAPQQRQAILMTESQIDINKAAALSQAGYTKEQIQGIATKEGITAAEAADNLIKEKNIVITNAQTLSEETNQGVQRKGILGLAQKVGAWAVETAQKWKNTAATGANTVATGIQDAADKKHTATLWSKVAAWIAANWQMALGLLIIGLIVAAIIGLIYLIKALVKAIHNASPEGKLEAVNSKLKEINERLNETKDELDDLTSKWDTFTDARDALDELTVGTEEWKKQLKEVNAAAQDLIDTYPQLYDGVDENGVIQINEAKYQELLLKKQKAVTNQRQQQLLYSQKQAKLEDQIARKNVSKRIANSTTFATEVGSAASQSKAMTAGGAAGLYGAGALMAGPVGALIGAAGGIVLAANQEKSYLQKDNSAWIDRFAQIMGEQEFVLEETEDSQFNVENRKAIEAAFTKATEGMILDDKAYQEILNNADVLNEIAQASKETAENTRRTNENFVTNALQEGEVGDSEWLNSISKLLTNNAGNKDILEQVSARLTRTKENGDVAGWWASDKQANRKSIAAEYARVLKEEGQKVRLASNGVDVERWDEEETTYKKMDRSSWRDWEEYIETSKLSDSFKDIGENIYKGFQETASKRSQKDTNYIKKILTSEAAFSRNDIAYINKNGGLTNYLKEKAGIDLSLEENKEAAVKYQEEINKRIETLNKTFNGLKEAIPEPDKLSELLEVIHQFGGAEVVDELKGAIQKLSNLYGPEAAQSYMEAIQEAFNSINFDQLDNDTKQSIVTSLLSTDFTDASSIESFKASIQSLPSVTISAKEGLIGLGSTLGEISKVTQDIDTKALEDAVGALLELSESLIEDSRRVDAEQREALINSKQADANDFIKTAKGDYIYKGTTEQLRQATGEASLTLFSDNLKNLSTDIEKMNATAVNGSIEDYDSVKSDVTSKVSSIVSTYIEAATTGAADIQRVLAMSNQLQTQILNKLYEGYNQAIDETQREQYQQLITEVTAQIWNLDDTIIAMASSIEGLEADIQDYYTALNNNDLIKAQLILNDIEKGVASRQFLNNLENDLSLMKDFTDNIDELGEEAKETNPIIQKSAKQLAAAFGVNNARTTGAKWFVENSELLKKVLVRDEEAITEFTNKMLQLYGIQVNSIEELNKDMSNLDNTKIQQLLNSGLYQAEKVTQLMEGEWYAFLENGKYVTHQYTKNMEGVSVGYKIVAQDADLLKEKCYDVAGAIEEIELSDIEKLINELERLSSIQFALSRSQSEYNSMLLSERASLEDLTKARQKTLDLTREEAEAEGDLAVKRAGELADFVASDKYNDLYSISQDQYGRVVISVNYDQLMTKEGEEYNSAVESIEKVRDLCSEVNSHLEAQYDLLDEMNDHWEESRDAYVSLIQEIYDALVQIEQTEIDKLSEINETIEKTNSDLIDAVRSSIDKMRQERENAKTEDDIAKQRARLAYLMMDTSGANKQEILNLQKSIEDAEESYSDNLIDQKLEGIQEQLDIAAEQRQDQITLLQNQLDYNNTIGAYWGSVNELLTTAFSTGDPNGLYTLLGRVGNWEGLPTSIVSQMQQDLKDKIAIASTYAEEYMHYDTGPIGEYYKDDVQVYRDAVDQSYDTSKYNSDNTNNNYQWDQSILENIEAVVRGIGRKLGVKNDGSDTDTTPIYGTDAAKQASTTLPSVEVSAPISSNIPIISGYSVSPTTHSTTTFSGVTSSTSLNSDWSWTTDLNELKSYWQGFELPDETIYSHHLDQKIEELIKGGYYQLGEDFFYNPTASKNKRYVTIRRDVDHGAYGNVSQVWYGNHFQLDSKHEGTQVQTGELINWAINDLLNRPGFITTNATQYSEAERKGMLATLLTKLSAHDLFNFLDGTGEIGINNFDDVLSIFNLLSSNSTTRGEYEKYLTTTSTTSYVKDKDYTDVIQTLLTSPELTSLSLDSGGILKKNPDGTVTYSGRTYSLTSNGSITATRTEGSGESALKIEEIFNEAGELIGQYKTNINGDIISLYDKTENGARTVAQELDENDEVITKTTELIVNGDTFVQSEEFTDKSNKTVKETTISGSYNKEDGYKVTKATETKYYNGDINKKQQETTTRWSEAGKRMESISMTWGEDGKLTSNIQQTFDESGEYIIAEAKTTFDEQTNTYVGMARTWDENTHKQTSQITSTWDVETGKMTSSVTTTFNEETGLATTRVTKKWDTETGEMVSDITEEWNDKTEQWEISSGSANTRLYDAGSDLIESARKLSAAANSLGLADFNNYNDSEENLKNYSEETGKYTSYKTGEDAPYQWVATSKRVLWNEQDGVYGTVYGVVDFQNYERGKEAHWDTQEFSSKDYGSNEAALEAAKERAKYLNLHGYKTGGLADFTGPAWLDGTKSKPEIVLDAQDSANFIALRDILSEILHGTSSFTSSNEQAKQQSNGDAYYDIQIQVDSISSDYDVDSLAERLKQDLLDTASYRNVTRASNRR